MTDKPSSANSNASSPCFAHQLEQNPDGSFAVVDEQQKADVGRWRKAERQRLIAARLDATEAERASVLAKIEQGLNEIVAPGSGHIISLYWPFRGELDLREWMHSAHQAGARIALPIVEAKHQPLVFREWTPGCSMERGVWNILQPADTVQITPNVVVSPLVGYDPNCYRLGYGGGYFDRTLAAMDTKPQVVGVGLSSAAILTIFPQPHDVPMDVILTGGDPVFRQQ